jgi:hypothetical protein
VAEDHKQRAPKIEEENFCFARNILVRWNFPLCSKMASIGPVALFGLLFGRFS